MLPLPGVADAESISLNKKKGMGIFILTIPGGSQSKGKIKGAHTKARPPHPLFGTRSRTRMLIDEAQEVAQNIYTEIPNRFSTVSEDDNEHIKFIVTANPKDPFSPFGQNLKPVGGYQAIAITDETWRSEARMVGHQPERDEPLRTCDRAEGGSLSRVRHLRGHANLAAGLQWRPRAPGYVHVCLREIPAAGNRPGRSSESRTCRNPSEGVDFSDGQTENFAYVDWGYSGDLATIAGNARSGRAIGWHDYQGNRHELPKLRHENPDRRRRDHGPRRHAGSRRRGARSLSETASR